MLRSKKGNRFKSKGFPESRKGEFGTKKIVTVNRNRFKEPNDSKFKIVFKAVLRHFADFMYLLGVTLWLMVCGLWDVLVKGFKAACRFVVRHPILVSFSVLIILMAVMFVMFSLQIKSLKEELIVSKDSYMELEEHAEVLQMQLDNTRTEWQAMKDLVDERDSRITDLESKNKQLTSRSGVVRSTTTQSNTTPASTGSKADYQAYAKQYMLDTYGWGDDQFQALVNLWEKESNWNPNAHNNSSGAHGIPQSLPASKMASFGEDYYTNGNTQIRWGLDYIKNRYGNPQGAWNHFLQKNWY